MKAQKSAFSQIISLIVQGVLKANVDSRFSVSDSKQPLARRKVAEMATCLLRLMFTRAE
jgi:hypothetical protein